jgi:hypothetical protein
VPEPVNNALAYIEPLFIDAARREWEAVKNNPYESLPHLKRCCATWVAARRPDESIDNVLALAEGSVSAVTTAIELLEVISTSLARLPVDDLVAMNVLDLIGHAVPAIVGYTQLAEYPDELMSDFGLGLTKLFHRYTEDYRQELINLIRVQRRDWEAIGVIRPGQEADEVF